MTIKKLKLGTRTSHLAMAQSRLVAQMLRAAHPGIEIEFVGVNTSGDVNQTTPLSQMYTVGIFTKQIDDELLAGNIDLAVHSLKDLGTQRPDGLITAAIPPRALPYDTVLFRPETMEILRSGRPLKIGTSAPRRTELVPKFLERALPKLLDGPHEFEMVPIRGNMNTRLKRLCETDERAMDGIMLAFAGLSRLFADAEAHETVRKQLQGLKWMIMPLTVCPGAPGQAAMAVETRSDRADIIEILRAIHDAQTAADVAAEIALLKETGGGCHQRFGVVQLHLENMQNPVMIIRGCDQSGKPMDEMRCDAPDFTGKKIWRGSDWTRKIFNMQRMIPEQNSFPAIFAANSRAVPADMDSTARLWTSGTASWFNLAAEGYWVEGCADGFGFDFIRPLIADPVLQLPPLSAWGVYTHVDAADGWDGMQVAPTYKLVPNPPEQCIGEIRTADVLIWASGSQFDALHAYARADAVHVCGPGKTAEYLRKNGVKNLVVMPLFD